jgi:anti-anti-sigma factor
MPSLPPDVRSEIPLCPEGTFHFSRCGYNYDMEFYYHDVQENVMVISADGGLNRQTADQFTDSIITLIEAGLRNIIVDCEKLTYISSIGVSVLLRLRKRAAKAGGEVKIANVHNRITEVLAMLRLGKAFAIYPSVDKALHAFELPEIQA